MLDPTHGNYSTVGIAFPEAGFYLYLHCFLTSVESDCTGIVLGESLKAGKHNSTGTVLSIEISMGTVRNSFPIFLLNPLPPPSRWTLVLRDVAFLFLTLSSMLKCGVD